MMLLIECFVRVSLLLGLAFAGSVVLRRQPAALRHLIWVIALGIAFLTPLLMLSGPQLIPAERSVSSSGKSQVNAAKVDRAKAKRIGPVQPIAAIASPSSPALRTASNSVSNFILLLWGAGALVFAIRTATSVWKAHLLRAHATFVDPAEIAIRAQLPPAALASVRVAESDSIAVPMTMGVWAPLILMPARHGDWGPRLLRSVLLHELAHVERRDCVAQWLAQAVCVLHWFNPLVWIARSLLLWESERASDDAVIRAGMSESDFAGDLLDIAQTATLKGNYPMSLAFTSELERRIVRLMDTSANRKPLTKMRAAVACLVGVALLLPVAGIRAQDAAALGTLAGVVSDPSGAVIPNARVVVWGAEGFTKTTYTSATGTWSFSDLPAGQNEYSLEIQVPGFVTSFNRIRMPIASSQPVRVENRLTVGPVSESLTVVGKGTPRASAEASNGPKRIRVGGNVQAAKLISRTAPVYPESARQQGIEGTVKLKAIIGKTGNVGVVEMVGNLGSNDLAQAALAAVRTWQYQPTLLNGEPVEIITEITVDFRLQ